MSNELLEVQTQLSFQEDSLQTLNDVVTRQQKDIERLTLEIGRLREQFQTLVTMQLEEQEEPPPHY
ncbi:SlyX family protein [Kistimonas asteriae]|uniref:SlyX family protein n=1 Tax=Kistimonas asteriae TaxID=517724 RepID=UPI001BAA3506|nr:SlyX family protein [Kistimonas asteriae]